ncbi:MAG TPA: hypothetical protein VNN17_12105 [Terriglobia bacterium]|nr:hypothetical protein [Terriglobia bacterium]
MSYESILSGLSKLLGALSIDQWLQVLGVLFVALAAREASRIGKRQNEINQRLLELQDFVAVVIVPFDSLIKVLNVGGQNLYLWGFDLPANPQWFERPRLLAAGAREQAWYWLPPPSPTAVQQGLEFSIVLYLEDESGKKWKSEHGGVLDHVVLKEKDGQPRKECSIRIWSYKIKSMEESDWEARKPKA